MGYALVLVVAAVLADESEPNVLSEQALIRPSSANLILGGR